MVDGNEQSGYILASDANGTATWTDPSTISLGGSTGTYGEMYESNALGSGTEITFTDPNTYYPWETAETGEVSNVTFSNEASGVADRLTITETGSYQVTLSISYMQP